MDNSDLEDLLDIAKRSGATRVKYSVGTIMFEAEFPAVISGMAVSDQERPSEPAVPFVRPTFRREAVIE